MPQSAKSELEKLVKNFEYRMTNESTKYKLENGHYESGSPTEDYINLRLEAASFGDLNNDGKTDAAVILVANYGGSGSFYELTALISGEGLWLQTNNLELGDRVQVNNLRVENGTVVVDLLIHGPEDPMCCPSQPRSLRFRVMNGILRETK
ncbi:MAG: hypothetical protein ACUVRL_10515 [Candidatus Saccharicenans sp.]